MKNTIIRFDPSKPALESRPCATWRLLSMRSAENAPQEQGTSAYDTVIGLLSKVKPTAAQQQAIDEKLTLLKVRLEAVGERF